MITEVFSYLTFKLYRKHFRISYSGNTLQQETGENSKLKGLSFLFFVFFSLENFIFLGNSIAWNFMS